MPENSGRSPGLEPGLGVGVSLIAAAWSVFQLWIASPLPFSFNFGIISGVPARGIHLAFALLLVFLVFPLRRRQARQRIAVYDVALAIVAAASALRGMRRSTTPTTVPTVTWPFFANQPPAPIAIAVARTPQNSTTPKYHVETFTLCR